MEKAYTKESRKYNHLTAEDRGKIEAYWRQRFSISAMAREMNRSKSTIYEEDRSEQPECRENIG